MKAILELYRMPESCGYCILSVGVMRKNCPVLHKQCPKEGRHKDCPLKPVE